MPHGNKIIFVVGTGRSGTHMVGHLLDSHPEIHVTIESPETFQRVVDIAIHGDLYKIPELLKIYQGILEEHPVYADKSHPALWFAETLEKHFRDSAHFIAIERDPHAVVASMLEHKGVLTWQDQWRKLPVPNPFLGITREIEPIYDTLSDVERCALRWKSHRDRLRDLSCTLKRFLRISYEIAVEEPELMTSVLSRFLGVPDHFDASVIRKVPVKVLSPEQKKAVDRIIHHGPPPASGYRTSGESPPTERKH